MSAEYLLSVLLLSSIGVCNDGSVLSVSEGSAAKGCLRGHECNHITDSNILEECIARGEWDCHGHDEYCHVHLGKDHLNMDCVIAHPEHHGPGAHDEHKPPGPHDGLEECQHKQHENHEDCNQPPLESLHDPHRQCNYCCQDLQCLITLASQPPPTPAHTPLTTAPHNTHSGHPIAGHNNCFTTDCPHDHHLHSCFTGQWACTHDQSCEVDMLLHLCTRPEDYYQHDCHFCCPDEQCFKTVYNLLTSPRPSPSVQPPATSSHLSTAAFQQSTSYTLSSQPLTTSQQPSTSAQAPPDNCTDKYDEHFCIDAAADCDNPIVHDVCPKTCGFCGCQDLFTGDCAATYAGQCSNHIVRRICPLMCHACNGPPVAARMAKTSSITQVTTTTVTTTTTTIPPTTTMPVTSPTTTVPHVAGTCFSCSGLDCLLNPTKLDCQAGYCMTTVMDTTHGRDIKRECATKRQCDGILLQPTCRQIENKILGAGVTCAYCCNHPDCNEPPSLIPDAASLITHH